MDRQDQEWSCMPKEKRARLEAEPGLVDATQSHAGEGVVGQNIIDQLMKKEQEVADHLLKSGKVENKKEQDRDEVEEATSCSRKEEMMDRAEGKVLEPGPTVLRVVGPEFLFKGVAGNSGTIEQQMVEETKACGKDVIVEDEDPPQAIVVAPGVKEEVAALPTVSHSEEEIIIKEDVVKGEVVIEDNAGDILEPVVILEEHVKGEVVIEDDVKVVEDAGDILQPVVILDAQSVGRSRERSATGQMISKAFDHFAKKGFKVVVFLPKAMVVKKVKDASDEVKAALKLTVKNLPCTGENPWGLDKWEVVQYAVDNQALLVTNDNYNNLSFESKAFKEQIETRLVGFSWDWGEFSLSTERKTEAWYPNLNSINWRRGPDSLVTDRQKQIAEMEARLDDLVPYERQRLVNMKEMEAREVKQRSIYTKE